MITRLDLSEQDTFHLFKLPLPTKILLIVCLYGSFCFDVELDRQICLLYVFNNTLSATSCLLSPACYLKQSMYKKMDKMDIFFNRQEFGRAIYLVGLYA